MQNFITVLNEQDIVCQNICILFINVAIKSEYYKHLMDLEVRVEICLYNLIFFESIAYNHCTEVWLVLQCAYT